MIPHSTFRTSIMSATRIGSLVIALVLLMGGCTADSEPSDPPEASATAEATDDSTASPSSFTATGTVRSLTPSGSHVMIRHGDIPGFMDAMTMVFETSHDSLVTYAEPADSIRFRFTAGSEGAVIRSITVVE